MRRTLLLLVAGLALSAPRARAGEGALDGAQVYREQCGRCHQPRAPGDLDPGAWSLVLFHMRTRALLTAAEVDALEAFMIRSAEPADSPLLESADVAAACVRCHDASRIEQAVAAGRSAEEWESTIKRMKVYGCAVDAETAERIARWLAEQDSGAPPTSPRP